MRILISTKLMGGAGGIERHVASTIRSLGRHHEIDVCPRRVVHGEYFVRPAHGRVVRLARWHAPEPERRLFSGVWRVAGPILRYRPAPYDVYLHYQYGENLLDRFTARVALVIPCGAPVSQEARFDAVLLEAPDNDKWVGDPEKAVILPPPLDVPAARAEVVEHVPPDFFLTVFNPYGPSKGLDDLREVAPRSPVPIVWCRSSQYSLPDPAVDLTGVVVMKDLTQAQLRFLYERCRAYVSFDNDPGFGWSLADALQYGAPTLSQGRGVMSLRDIDTQQTYQYETLDDLIALLERCDFRHVERRLDSLAPHHFVARFEDLVMSLAATTGVDRGFKARRDKSSDPYS
jgi:hypothetical protein